MRDFDRDEVRREGPWMVRAGQGPGTLVVLDPAGAAKHDELPATWRELTADHTVVWIRLPAGGSLSEVDDELVTLARDGGTVDLVTSGPEAEAALRFATQHAEAVRSVLLVDPAAEDTRFERTEADIADALWEKRMRPALKELTEAGVAVRVIAHSHADSEDRVPAPLPLGHPEVVTAVRHALAEIA
ncbi:hypothetical protein EV193_107212 [Herbihabitans rhizosphaerae]|uniref:AAA domain-containing protein n=1 Tax=Herbihabitans rhizosphaerae TaxID=1872711 RepID=A0A4Q7KLU3_9PSEU|nr:hypothetical protein [Herbihabitans rhizosphaerae]RZS36531.1 hypothetical protein EV193_107212 [Herbihabitans rhizosphaerae]